jgi:serine/threonine protein kinase/beta-lactam-binding protein with PASTA domain
MSNGGHSGEPHLVGGRYELGELLGRGGMAEVRKGTDTRLGRIVAIKRLRTDLASDATFQARFRREAQSSAALNHPSIVSVYDTGEEMTDHGIAQPYIVMEYVAGRTLRDILREGRKILPERALELSSGVLSALDYSHRAGIIHRDIKPGNVMLTPSGDVKVMDFGIARAVSDASSTMTATAAVVGTAQYLSPEQARGETVDSRSDVYSAGCLLYELLTGRPPFVGDSPVAVAYQHVREPATPPSQHDMDIPAALDAIVMKSLAKRVEDRYQSAAAMRSDIERYLAGRPVQAPVVPVPAPEPAYLAPEPTPTAVTRAVPPAPPYDDEPQTRTGLIVFLAVLLLAVIGAAAFFLPKLMESPAEKVQVPNLVNLPQQLAEQKLVALGLPQDFQFRKDDTVKENYVIEQQPSASTYVDPGATITVWVSSGKPSVTVPFVANQSKTDAQTTLAGDPYDFQVKLVEEDSDLPKDTVIRTEPAAGASVPKGTKIKVFFSDGPEQIPSVVNMQVDAAEAALRAKGFEPFVVESDQTTLPAGTVIRQNPGAGQTAPQGTSVTIVVSSYQPPSSPTESSSPTETSSPLLPTGSPTP